MRKFYLALTIATLLGAGSAQADQWQASFDQLNVLFPNDASQGHPLNTALLQMQAGACVGGLPQQATFFAGPIAVPCTMAGFATVEMSIESFASEADLVTLGNSFAALSAQFATTNAQFLQALQTQAREANIGIAQALAMAGTADLQADENYAVAFNVGTYGGRSAFAAGAVARIDEHVSVNAGFTSGVGGGQVGARAGIRFGW